MLFPRPMTLETGRHTANGAPANASQTNTNLEQISEWLTEILVGAGLTMSHVAAEVCRQDD